MFNECVFKGNCPRERRKGCTDDCTIRPEIEFLLSNSNLPTDYLRKKKLYPEMDDMDAFMTLDDIRKDIVNFVKDGRFLYIWSKNCGVGKTEMAVKIMKTFFALKCIGNGFHKLGWFNYIPTFTLLSKEFDSEERLEHIQNSRDLDLVIMDDIGSINSSNYDITILSSIIDYRKSHGKATIFTSNLSIDSLERNVGARIADRVGSDIVIELKGGSRRTSTNKYIPKE